MMDGSSTNEITPKSYADWVSATVTTADVTVGRSGWADSPLTPYARRFRQYAIICASLNASNVAAVPLRLYSRGDPKRKRSKTAAVPKDRRKWLRSKHVGAKASGYAAYADDKVQEVVDHPAMRLIRKPNPWMAGSFFVEWIDSSMEITGNAFVYATSERSGGLPTMLLPLMPHYTKVIPSETGMVAGYYYGRDKYEIATLTPEEVCHFKFRPNPLDPYYGLAPIAAALVESDLAHQATVSEWHRWQNGGRPDFAVKIDPAATVDQKKQIRAEIEAYTRGAAKCGNFLLLTGAEVMPLGFAPKEMEYLAGLARSDELIWNAFGVPQSLVKLNDANLASSETGHVQYHKLTINPRCARIAETLTEFVLPIFGVEPGDMWFAFDDASDDAADDESMRLVSLTAAGIMTIDEARACEGLEPLEGGLGAIPRVGGQVLSLVAGDPLSSVGDGEPAKPDGADVAPVVEDAVSRAEPLNGAQVTALTSVITQVATGQLPIESAREVIAAAFPMLDAEMIEGILSPLRNFTPETAVSDAPPEPRLEDAAGDGNDGNSEKSAQAGRGTGDKEQSIKDAASERGVGQHDGDRGNPEADNGKDSRVECPLCHRGSISENDEPAAKSHVGCCHKAIGVGDGLTFYGHRGITAKAAGSFTENAAIEKLARAFYQQLVAYYTSQSGRLLDDGPSATLKPTDGGLLELIERNLMDLHNAGVLEGYKGQGASSANVPALTVAQAERYVGSYVPKLAQSISDDLAASLRDAVVNGMAQGQTYQQVAAEIQTVIPEMADWRAERVARTETSRAIGSGELAAWEQLGIDGKEWILSGNACEFCEAIAAANPDPIPITQPFARMGQVYGGVTVTWEDIMVGGTAHPDCGCDQAAVMLDDEDEPNGD